MTTVLLTAIGSASAHSAQQSLTAAGCRVIGCDIYPKEWNVNAADMAAFYTVPRAADGAPFFKALAQIVRDETVDFIIPLTDIEVDALSPRKAEFAALGAVVCCPDKAVATLCRHKLNMAQLLKDAGVCPVIPTWTAQTLPPEAAFPLLLKPVHGRSSEGQRIVQNAAELTAALAAREDYIIQPYLPGDVYTVDCARDKQGGMVTLTRRECLRSANGLGTAVTICPGHPLDAVCRRILETADIAGVVNMEFIHHGDTYYFLEVNPRFSGGVGFSVLAGYDFPMAQLRCHRGEALPPPPVFRALSLAQRYEMHITAGS